MHPAYQHKANSYFKHFYCSYLILVAYLVSNKNFNKKHHSFAPNQRINSIFSSTSVTGPTVMSNRQSHDVNCYEPTVHIAPLKSCPSLYFVISYSNFVQWKLTCMSNYSDIFISLRLILIDIYFSRWWNNFGT